jgi:hypothetical protein
VLTPLALLLTLRGRNAQEATIAAALITTATEIYIFIGAWRLRAPGVLDRATVGKALRAVCAAALIPLALLPFDGVSFLVRIPIGVVVYLGAALAVRAVSAEDLARAVRALRSRSPRRSAPSSQPEASPIPRQGPG